MTKDFHTRFYVPSNMVISLVGDINPERDLPVVEKYFGRISAGDAPKMPDIVEPEQDGEREVVVYGDASPFLFAAYKKPSYPNPDDPPITLLEEILTGSTVSPVYKELVKEKRIAVSVSVGEAPGNAYPNLFYFTLVPRTPYSNIRLLSEFDQLINRLLKKGFTEEQLEATKRRIAMDFLGDMRSNQSLAVNFSYAELLYGKWNMHNKWFEDAMAVTLEDINRVARKYLNKKQRTIARFEDDRTTGKS